MITKWLSAAPGVKTDTGGYQRAGKYGVVLGLAGFLLWAGFAPLDQGVAASGTVVIAGNIKRRPRMAGHCYRRRMRCSQTGGLNWRVRFRHVRSRLTA